MKKLIIVLIAILLLAITVVARAQTVTVKATTPDGPQLSEPQVTSVIPLVQNNYQNFQSLSERPKVDLDDMGSNAIEKDMNGNEPESKLVLNLPPGPLPILDKENVSAEVNKIIKSFSTKSRNFSVLVAQGPNILLRSYGYIDSNNRIKSEENTPYLLASTTKQFTAALILMEVGKPTPEFGVGTTFRLDDPLTKYFSDAPDWWKKITIGSLLSHTSGLGDYLYDLDHWNQKRKGPIPIGKEALLRYIMSTREAYETDHGFLYSNSGYFILGLLLEKINHESYGTILKSEITTPLQMNNTGVLSPGMVFPNENNKDSAEVIAERKILRKNPNSIFAVGDIYSTLDDLYRWEMALFVNKNILPSALQRAMYTSQSNTMTIVYKNQSPEEKSKGMPPAIDHIMAYGFGLHLDFVGDKTIAWHTGHLSGCTTIIAHFIEDNLTIIVLTYDSQAPVRPLVNIVANKVFNMPPIALPPSSINVAHLAIKPKNNSYKVSVRSHRRRKVLNSKT